MEGIEGRRNRGSASAEDPDFLGDAPPGSMARFLRTQLGLSRTRVSKDSGVTTSRIKRIEEGGFPSLGELDGLARALGIAPRVFFGEIYEGEFPIDYSRERLSSRVPRVRR